MNVRNEKVMRMWQQKFKQHDLDFLMVLIPPTGNSAYNPVERRMSPLSHSLRSLVLFLFTHGQHLHGQKTIDVDMERKNFESCQKSLSELRNGTLLQHECVSESITDSSELDHNYPQLDHQFLMKHYRGGKKMLMIVKCNDIGCEYCSIHPTRSKWSEHIGSKQFMPSPFILEQDSDGIL
mgnify:CR=1 FL=1